MEQFNLILKRYSLMQKKTYLNNLVDLKVLKRWIQRHPDERKQGEMRRGCSESLRGPSSS